ncbi:coproporphyrinogen III oxidase [Paenibacillus ferrarius]|uniref:Heme chaperone HemW n=1 Tax=Paenibacillus ferrarius TaxID=1469647 RepID=A0A1V4HK50_9BACL|nr:STM4012 family radical SAM protein [Paenibacillus ferrarius]OPH57630.1 coproporphyrinogen III oxidase [Paenibacillus ferrarius]
MTSRDNTTSLRSWSENLRSEPYRSYLYSYPHKTAYRELEPKAQLSELWRNEPAETLFLYMHIPFCGARCGFCNLFTLPDKRTGVHQQYVDALERQAREWAPIVGDKPFARFAIGGGTPTLLEPYLLERLFTIAEGIMGLDAQQASISVETSPETVTEERLRILHEHRVDRVSMGIQSFIEEEAAAIYRPQKPLEVERALALLKREPFPILNLDLIYGLPGQSVQSWLYSLDRALAYEPEEIFIYPLYTREQTIVKPEQIRRSGEDVRMACYLAARDRLRGAGYQQHSMRRFSKQSANAAKQLLPYGCQEDGMVGLGCGARSYTRELHYASRYAVDRQATASIIADYVAAKGHDTADYGYMLNLEEQQRRFILKAILHSEGLELSSYKERFGSEALTDYSELHRLLDSGLALQSVDLFQLTEEGLAYSDAIGDWFISPAVRERMEGFVFV